MRTMKMWQSQSKYQNRSLGTIETDHLELLVLSTGCD